MPFPELLVTALFIQPLLVLLHELGHFYTGRLLRLEPIEVTVGVGPKLWSGALGGDAGARSRVAVAGPNFIRW